eukprot:2249547-Prymnesium_polylepis.1
MPRPYVAADGREQIDEDGLRGAKDGGGERHEAREAEQARAQQVAHVRVQESRRHEPVHLAVHQERMRVAGGRDFERSAEPQLRGVAAERGEEEALRRAWPAKQREQRQDVLPQPLGERRAVAHAAVRLVSRRGALRLRAVGRQRRSEHQLLRRLARGAGTTARMQCHRCLLYTSDAADDM